jgi:methylglyoxal synthase
MSQKKISMEARKSIALIAHDSMKDDLLEWASENKKALTQSTLYATGTTGRILSRELGIDVHNMKNGPLGGDLQIGTKIAEEEIDVLIFFWDPLEAQPHAPDVKALLRHGSGMEYSCCHQPGNSRFYIFITAHGTTLSALCSGL